MFDDPDDEYTDDGDEEYVEEAPARAGRVDRLAAALGGRSRLTLTAALGLVALLLLAGVFVTMPDDDDGDDVVQTEAASQTDVEPGSTTTTAQPPTTEPSTTVPTTVPATVGDASTTTVAGPPPPTTMAGGGASSTTTGPTTTAAPTTTGPPTTSPSSPTTTTAPPSRCPQGGVALGISTDRASYRPGDVILVTVTATNTTAEPCWVPTRDGGDPALCQPKVVIHREEVNDRGEVTYNVLLGPYHAACEGDQRVLAPDEPVAVTIEARFGSEDEDLRPGTYDVIAEWAGASDQGVTTTIRCER